MPPSTPVEMLGPVDTAFLYVESDTSPMNIGAVTVFRGRLDCDALIHHIEVRIHQAPLYQKRLIETPINLGGPAWRFDPDFYVPNHVFRHELEPPGTEGQLRELAGQLISQRLDRSKPLWEVHLIYGLNQIGDQQGEFTAALFKVHHAMVDGLSAIDLITLLFDLTPEGYPTAKKPIYDPPDLPAPLELIVESLQAEVAHKLGVLNKLRGDLEFLGGALGNREKRRRMFRGLANLINDNLKPIAPLAINGRNSGRITVAWADFSLAEVRAIRSQRRCTVNDVMVCVLAAALERYERDQRGQRSRSAFLRVLVPVNMRVENEKDSFGNRISVLPLDVPFGLDDPLARLDAVSDYSAVMKNSFLANTLDMVLTLPALALAPVQPLIWSIAPAAFAFLAHTWCTNVAGPQIPIYLLGHEMLRSFGFFPLNPSMGLACVVMSYNQRITMTLIADAGIVPDVIKIKAYLEASFAELRRAAQVEPVQPLVLEPVKVNVPTQAAGRPAAPEATVQADPAPAAAPLETAASARTEPVHVDAAEPGPAIRVEPAPVVAAVLEAEAQPVEGIAGAPVSAPDAPSLAHPEAHVNGRIRLRLFSEPWAQAFMRAINDSAAYRAASTKWTAGSLAFIMKAAPARGFSEDTAVIMDLYRGHCRSAHNRSAPEACAEAAFVIEGDYHTWMRVLAGAAPPLTMLVRGELHLRKGSLIRLIPFTQSAQELLKCAQRIPIAND